MGGYFIGRISKRSVDIGICPAHCDLSLVDFNSDFKRMDSHQCLEMFLEALRDGIVVLE